MATDSRLVLANLTAFYDFGGKAVIHVGAGGGQFVRYAEKTRSVLAIDNDPGAVAQLKAAIAAAGLADRFTVRLADFESIEDRGDVVFFEFCLHEIPDPDAALAHARNLAPDTLVIDHAPDSLWTWYTAESDKARHSWAAVERCGIRRDQRFLGRQCFTDVEALLQKVAPQGEPAVSRSKALAGIAPIKIPMTYRAALV